MDDKTSRSSDAESFRVDPSSVENKILEEFNAIKKIKPITFDQKAKSFFVPEYQEYNEKMIHLEDTDCEYKAFLFSILYTIYYRAFVLGDQPKCRCKEIHSGIIPVVKFLNDYAFEEGKESKFFKDFEVYKINDLKLKPSSSGLSNLLRWVKEVYEFDGFSINSLWQYRLVQSAICIKAQRTSSDNVKQTTLTEWFGYSTWLRRDDIGIGHDLYSRLASPKALVASFITTICVQLNEIQLAKDALIDFFRAMGVKPSDFPVSSKSEKRTATQNCKDLGRARHKSLKKLQKLYCTASAEEKACRYLRLAMLFVIREFSYIQYFELMKEAFLNNKSMPDRIDFRETNKRNLPTIRTASSESLFGLNFLNDLARYTSTPRNIYIDKPKSLAEQTIFSWLMAYQTVQPTDISKLKLKDFKFVRRNNGRVTHIDLQYFKGRAKIVHQVRTLNTSTLLGSVVLNYIEDLVHISKEDSNKHLVLDVGTRAPLERIFESSEHDISDKIHEQLVKEKTSPVFLKAMLALIRNGVQRGRGMPYSEYVEACERRVQLKIFTLTAIKNSSVHSRSDTFTPTQLINYHSHSDQVEKDSYLGESNEEWKNNAGLITRAVMHDLTTNLFRASETDQAVFNSEFTRAAETISIKKQDVLAKLKLITGKVDGKVNHLGLVKNPSSELVDSPDTIYLLDTPETVMKLLHYRDEVKRNHHLLAESASEFLLFTVLPTVEWIEELFDKKSFSNKSMANGESFYKKYKEHLSPLFQNQIR
tara:strand:- start:15753 stop:18029 length:2277 start_codon:yes stop_codon:yes gene_type:complete